MIGHPDIYSAYDMFSPLQVNSCIEYLMKKFSWNRFEAECYFYSEPYDESDWCDYE